MKENKTTDVIFYYAFASFKVHYKLDLAYTQNSCLSTNWFNRIFGNRVAGKYAWEVCSSSCF